MTIKRIGFNSLLMTILVIFGAGCGSTKLNLHHSLLATGPSSDVAEVYFIRPDEGFMGVAGIALTIYYRDETFFMCRGEKMLSPVQSYTARCGGIMFLAAGNFEDRS
ncbi:MAG: hypothetical protein ACYTG7_20340 [Planctomycetota bacterium]|jgi:hypothetical protein